MTLDEARLILGLKPDEEVAAQLDQLREARERIAAMVRDAPNGMLAKRFQAGLDEFDEALLVAQQTGAAGKAPIATAPVVVQEQEILLPDETDGPPAAPDVEDQESGEANEEEEEPEPGDSLGSRIAAFFIWMMVFLMLAAGGVVFYLHMEREKSAQMQTRIGFLEREAQVYLENRRWQEAGRVLDEIETLAPGSPKAARGRLTVEQGLGEEQTQFLGYWKGQAIAELEAGRFEEAEKAIQEIVGRIPNEPEIPSLRARLAESRTKAEKESTLAKLREQMNARAWDDALAGIDGLLESNPADNEAMALKSEAEAGKAKQLADQARARELLALAVSADTGAFNPQVLKLLQDAAVLDPKNPEIKARLETVASYTRTIRVPEDFPNLEEALREAKNRDRLLIGEGVWKSVLAVGVALEIQGAGSDKTIIECDPTVSSPLGIAANATGARISGLTFRHDRFHATGADRFAAATVRADKVTLTDCVFTNGSGHGLIVIDGGEVTATRCRFLENGWNGAAATGRGSYLEVRDSQASSNFENGLETWDNAAAVFLNNRCEGNSRNGIHIDSGDSPATVQNNQLANNREFGLVATSAESGRVSNNTAQGNLLGGIVVRLAAARLMVAENSATANQGPGLVLERGLNPIHYPSNKLNRNKNPQLSTDADLDPVEAKPGP
jgi:parallel beta-helix repeat protein